MLLLQGGTGALRPQSAWNGGAAFYAFVSATLLLRYVGLLLRTWRIRSAARVLDPHSLVDMEQTGWDARDLDVRSSTKVLSPATFGRTILLPAAFAGWDREKLAAVLAHERSHVLHRDCYVLWLARLHTCIFWISPMAWWLQSRLATLAETTSDQAAVKALGDRPGYAEILLEFARQRGVSDLTAAMARADITRRIEIILSEITPHRVPRLAQRLLVIAVFLPVVAATAAPLASTPAGSGASINASQPLPDLEKYYPREAMRKGIEGLVRIRVTLDSKGRATDTLILSEDPLDEGFGAAASTMVHAMEFNNPTGRSAELEFNVKFALSHTAPQAHYGTTNFEESDTQ